MSNDLSLYEQIVDGWERTETENGSPYYVNHKTERTSWNHPYWLKIVEGLKEHDGVKYSAYRTSLKIRQLQKQLRLNHVEISTIRNEFEEVGYAEGAWGEIHCEDLLTVLVNVFRHSPDSYTMQEEPDMLADITLNLLLNLFDKDKTGCVMVMSVKLMLVTLCCGKLTDKYRYFYQELHDPSTYVNSHVLTGFLDTLMQLPEFLHESIAFGRNCEPAVASCCQMSQENGGITEDVFYRWLQKEPQTIVWLPTFHRIVSTENVKHDAKCNVCKASPIIGFRYKCLKCFNFDLCQNCFFTGRTKKRHKLSHPIQEYCLNSTAKDDTSAFVKTIKNNLSRKQRRKARLKYLPIEADSQYTNPAWSPGYEPPEPDVHSEILETAKKLADVEVSQNQSEDTTDLGFRTPPEKRRLFSPPKKLSPKDDGLQIEREELNAYIQQLEEENRALYAQMVSMKENSDTESFVSDDRFSPDQHSQVSPNTQRPRQVNRDPEDLSVREPHPSETTPVFLSVPIIHVNGHPFRSFTSSPKTVFDSPGLQSAFHQPYYHSPVSYLQPPTYGSPPRERTLGDSLDNLEASPGKFSLPSPNKSFDEFHVEEAELQAIVNKIGTAFPSDLSMKGPHPSRLSTGEDEMLQAANSIGEAMSDFVNRAVNIRLPQ